MMVKPVVVIPFVQQNWVYVISSSSCMMCVQREAFMVWEPLKLMMCHVTVEYYISAKVVKPHSTAILCSWICSFILWLSYGSCIFCHSHCSKFCKVLDFQDGFFSLVLLISELTCTTSHTIYHHWEKDNSDVIKTSCQPF